MLLLSSNSTDSPCDGCASTFSYVNLLNLTNDTTRLVVRPAFIILMFLLYLRELFIGWCAGFVLLQDALSAIRVSGNLDPPESLLDGLMQSVVCQKVRYIVFFFLYLLD